jgi:type IV pilus assembly protein PilY1
MRILNSLPSAALAAALTLLGTTPRVVHADDTDLYMSPNKAVGAEPLIMFALDYRSNLGSTYGGCTNASTCTVANTFREYEAAKDQVDALGTGKLTFFDALRFSLRIIFNEYSDFKAGLLLPHSNTNNCVGPDETDKCSNGGYIPFGFTTMDSAGKEDFLDKLDTLPQTGGTVSHSYQGIEMYFELYRYLKGWGVYNADLGWTDYGSNNSKNVGQNGDTGENHGVDESIISNAGGVRTYTSPFDGAGDCVKSFVINFLFQVTNQENDSDTAIAAAATSAGQGMGFNPANNSTGFPSVVSYMKNNDLASSVDGVQGVTSYFVSTFDNTTTRSYATAGGTSLVELSEDPAELIEALENIFREILSTSTTFVSASVPVNVFNRAESLDNVFIALFQVDADGKPDWIGNLKKLKIQSEEVAGGGTEVYLADANGDLAIGNEGRIEYSALTYWTRAGDLPAADTSADEVEGADGRVVDRGAAGQKVPGFIANDPGLSNPGTIPSTTERALFYDPADITNGAAGGTAMLPLNATTTVADLLIAQSTDLATGHRYKYPFGGAAAPTQATAVDYLEFARGYDTTDRDGDSVTAEARPWVWGAPLHSRPLPISYGVPSAAGYDADDEDDPLIYVAIGGDDGFLHFVRNSLPGDTADTDLSAGLEVWAFMPQEVMDNLPTLQTNSSSDSHPYGVDGPAASYTYDDDQDGTVETADGDYVHLYFGLRRGGRAMYGLDVSNPESPKILWRITNDTTDFSELGYTFSAPKLGFVNIDLDSDGSANDPVVIFAGGYDTNKDSRGAVGTDDSMGNAFYVVNANTGALVWKAVSSGTASATLYPHANLTDGISSEVAVADTDGDGYTDRVLFGDTGGQVWRVDMSGATTNWKITRLANLGRHVSGDETRPNDRRFHHRPDLVPSKDGSGSFDAVVIGSGDRENPLDRDVGQTGNSLGSHTTDNFLYMIKDRQTTPYINGDADPAVVESGDLYDVTDNCIEADSCASTPDLSDGWKLGLEVGPGEKNLSSPLTVTNTIFFTTFLPLGTDADIVDGSTDTEAATCGPQEGKGLLYAVNLADATSVTNFNVTRDGGTGGSGTRYSELASAGIPAEVVGVSFGGQAYVLPPDLNLEAIQASTRWRTFWYEVEDGD